MVKYDVPLLRAYRVRVVLVPGGRPLTASATVPLKPPDGATAIVYLIVPPRPGRLRTPGPALRAKSGALATRLVIAGAVVAGAVVAGAVVAGAVVAGAVVAGAVTFGVTTGVVTAGTV